MIGLFYFKQFCLKLKPQLSRRNITPESASYLRGKRYNSEKKEITNPDVRRNH